MNLPQQLLLLPIALHGPIGFLGHAADALGWAHCVCNSSCRQLPIAPHIFQIMLPIFYEGPMHVQLMLLPMASFGPIHLTKGAADALGRAYCVAESITATASLESLHLPRVLPIPEEGPMHFLLPRRRRLRMGLLLCGKVVLRHRMGPLHLEQLPTATALLGPIQFSEGIADTLRWANAFSAAAAASGFAWTRYIAGICCRSPWMGRRICSCGRCRRRRMCPLNFQ